MKKRVLKIGLALGLVASLILPALATKAVQVELVPDWLQNPTYTEPFLEAKNSNDFEIDISGNKVEIGSKTEEAFDQTVKYNRWGGESWFSISLYLSDKITTDASVVGNKVIWGEENPYLGMEIYALDNTKIDAEFGGVEYNVVLKQKPVSNTLYFEVTNSPDVAFYYQPSLAEVFEVGDYWHGVEIHSVSATELKDKDGKRMLSRPENAVGSYAIYSTEKEDHILGEINYATGKIGHIFRPKAIDSKGWEVWGELNIENGWMTVTLPQEFIDKAIYPIYHSAGLDFGYTGTGNADDYPPANMLFGSTATSPADAGITGISMSAYGYNGDGVKLGIWANSDGGALLTNALTPEISPDAILGWDTGTFATGPAIAASTTYMLCTINNDGAYVIKLDNTQGVMRQDWTNSYANPGNFDWDSDQFAYRFSLYVTYELAGGNDPPSVTTNAADDLEDTTATLNGEVTDDGGATIDYYGFVWDDDSDEGDPGDTDPSGPPGTWENGWKSGEGDYGENPSRSIWDRGFYPKFNWITNRGYYIC